MMSLKGLLFTEKELHFREGDIIFKEQEEGVKEMYFIDSGRVRIAKKIVDSEITLGIFNSGDFFGEMACITGNKRSASAIAYTDCKLHSMDKETFESNLINDKNFMRKMLKILAFRLEEAELITFMNISRHLQGNSRQSKPSI